ncbi:MAG TPA: site-specific integrase [Burkholderiales bacterium]|jgi:integrase
MATIRKRIGKAGDISYHVQVRISGHPPLSASFERKTDATRWGAERESEIRNGRHFPADNNNKHTAGDMIDRYLRDVVPTKPKAARDLNSQLAWWKKEIGSYALRSLSPVVIHAARDKLSTEITVRGKLRSSGTVLRYLMSLSTVLTTATRDWNWLDRSPMEKVVKPKPARDRVRFLDDDERKDLLRACKESDNPFLYIVVMLAISTGMRLGEITSLRWENVDLDFSEDLGRAYLLMTKNGDRRSVPIAGKALDVMREHKTNVQCSLDAGTKLKGYLFPSTRLALEQPMDLRTPWESALAKSGVQNFRFHDLRHTAASYLAMNNATPSELAEVLGHKQLQMVKRYAHLSELHTASVVAKMNKKMFSD